MRKIAFIVLVSLIGLNLQAQNFEKVKNEANITWFGLDFTHVKLIGSSQDFSNPEAIVNNYFTSWNTLIVKEYKKYNLSEAFRKKIDNNIGKSVALNETVSPENLVTFDKNKLSADDIKKIAAKYKQAESNGVGLIFAVENLDKLTSVIRFYIVFIDIKTGNMLYSKYIEGDVKYGIGFRNYWANGFYHGIQKIKKTYLSWE